MTQQVAQAQMERIEPGASADSFPGDRACANGTGNGHLSVDSLWHRLFKNATPAEQAEWLQAAQPTGILYTHQITSPEAVPPDNRQALLLRLLAGTVDQLEPFPSLSAAGGQFVPGDSALDAAQRQAVLRALHTPDIALIQGLPGTGKSRVIVELIRLATSQGERVLFLSPNPHALDQVLASVIAHAGVAALRCAAGEETSPALPEPIRALTASAYTDHFITQASRAVRQALADNHQHRQRLERDLQTLSELSAPVERWQQTETQQQQLSQQHQEVPGQVRELVEKREPAGASSASLPRGSEGGLLQQLEQETLRHRAALQALEERERQDRDQCTHCQQELQRWLAQVQAQTQVVEVRNSWRIYRLVWWQALFQGRARERLDEFRCRETEARKALADASAQLEALHAQQDLEKQHHQQAREQLILNEIARRQADLDRQLADLQRQREQHLHAWQQQTASLQDAFPSLALPSLAAVHAARQSAAAGLERLRLQATVIQAWEATLSELTPNLSSWLPRYLNLVAASPTTLAQDPWFGTHALHGRDFDLVILDQAEHLTEAELLALAGRGKRWVLVGQPALTPAEANERSVGSAATSLDAAALSPFHRLWLALHCDPRRLPYQWVQNGETLTCQLHALADEHRSWIEIERLEDQPEVELRILSLPRTPPVLAEVVFPTRSFTIARAKTYVYQQLNELTLRPGASSWSWHENGQRLYLHVADTRPAAENEVAVMVEDGVCEVVSSCEAPDSPPPHTTATSTRGGSAPTGARGKTASGTSRTAPAPATSPAPPAGERGGRGTIHWSTTRLEFDLTQGWSRGRAERWLQERTGLRDFGRTSLLETPWRSHPHLVAFAAGLLRLGKTEAGEGKGPDRTRPPAAAPTPAASPATELPVQFVPVPSASLQSSKPRGKGGPAPRTGKASTGLELSLADAKQRQRLPPELREGLPDQGLVNLAEAQAVIRMVQHLARHAPPGGPAASAASAAAQIAVLSWQPAQVQLLRRLWEIQAAPPTNVRFVPVSQFHGSEADIVLLSLCRSTGSGSPAYAATPYDWRTALLAARGQLILFGDVATLSRRSQGPGTTEPQDALTAQEERLITARLVEHLEQPDRASRLLWIREGAPT
jgi:hypothetical protein